MSRASVDAEFRDFVAARSAALMRLAFLLARDTSAADDLLQTALLLHRGNRPQPGHPRAGQAARRTRPRRHREGNAMTDDHWEPLERLAATAPPPAPVLADTVLARGRTVRRWRAAGAALAGAGTAVAVVIGTIMLVGTEEARTPALSAASTPTPPTPPTPPPTAGDPSPSMQVVAAAVRALIDESYPEARTLWVRDQLCASWHVSGSGECTDLTDQQQAELVRLLPGRIIEWLEDDRAPDGGPIRAWSHHPPVVQVSELDVDATGGSAFVLAVAGGLDCAGAEYDVTLSRDSPPVGVSAGQRVEC